jgi:hypothetical protein
MREKAERKLGVVSCVNELRELLERAPVPAERDLQVTLDLGQRVMPVLLRFPLDASGQKLGSLSARAERRSPGFDSGVYRPPRR